MSFYWLQNLFLLLLFFFVCLFLLGLLGFVFMPLADINLKGHPGLVRTTTSFTFCQNTSIGQKSRWDNNFIVVRKNNVKIYIQISGQVSSLTFESNAAAHLQTLTHVQEVTQRCLSILIIQSKNSMLTLFCSDLPCFACFTPSQFIPTKHSQFILLTVLDLKLETGDTSVGDIYFRKFLGRWLNHVKAQ